MQKKITKATVKSFIRKNRQNLLIDVKSRFDGMVDCVMPVEGAFITCKQTERYLENTYGIEFAWFVGSGDDKFEAYEENGFKGYKVYNCCGSFILAIKSLEVVYA